jgi:small-conductance mechanosensitive channel
LTVTRGFSIVFSSTDYTVKAHPAAEKVTRVSRKNRILCLALLLSVLFLLSSSLSAQLPPLGEQAKEREQPLISLPEDVGQSVVREAAKVKEQFKQKVRSLFSRTRLGWDGDTVEFFYRWILTLPLRIPDLMAFVLEQSRLLGAVGSLIMLTFMVAVFYSLIGKRRVLIRAEQEVQTLRERMPEAFAPYFLSILKVVVASLIPLLLLGAYSLVNAFIQYTVPWYVLTGRLLGLWALGALLLNLLRETLIRGLFALSTQYGKTIQRLFRPVILYVLAGAGIIWGAEAFLIPADVLAFLQFALTLSAVCILFLLFLKKRALMSLLPDLPYPTYQSFRRILNRYYYPLISLTFLSGILWCFGYREFCRVLWTKTWAVAGTYVAVTVVYHILEGALQKWSEKKGRADQEAQFLSRSIRSLLLYATVTATTLIILDLLGFLAPLQGILSFPVVKVGETLLSFWVFIKAVLILVSFVYASRMLEAFLAYKVYPSFRIDTGSAYALNTFLRYLLLAVGFLFSMGVLGLDLRVLMVFAGAVGIGVGLGLQSVAANVIAGFSIIFGRKLRKGDWIQVGETIGLVTDIFLRATQVRTRDHIEYLIPNTDFISKTVVNYTLSSPMIRIQLPVGVSYDADPQKVREVLLSSAEKHSEVHGYREPEVGFIRFAESSIDFELLVWIDIRNVAEKRIRSKLYFTIFEELKKAGIAIPFPQRDLHIRSDAPRPEAKDSPEIQR